MAQNSQQSPSLPTRYDHADIEPRLYELWEERECFKPAADRTAHSTAASDADAADSTEKTPSLPSPTGDSFTIMMPPPNANDPLHIGHAMFLALEDIMIRYHRMLGDDTLWLPGTDHAGIETQYVFEKKLRKKGKSRFSYGREELYQKIYDYVQENSDVAVNQMKKIGASADWSRFKFMLDEDIVDIVLETFMQLHDDDLIYRDFRLVNYCTKCGTGFSNLEIEREETTSPLYYLQYGPIQVATTRPETMFGDVAVAVHPDDERYADYVGTEIEVKLPEGTMTLPVIADDAVDPEFGTGAVKITPFHDALDWEIYKRHEDVLNEPQLAIDYDGKLTDIAGKFAKSAVLPESRAKIACSLEERETLIRIEKSYQNTVSNCYRCGRRIEPLPLPQFYVCTQPLTEPILSALDENEITVHGAGHDKILRHWLENLEDWNISRQIVWGIRIPVWYRVSGHEAQIRAGFIPNGVEDARFTENTLENLLEDYTLDEIKDGLQTLNVAAEVEDYVISKTEPEEDGPWIQETDTFDTWFSSAQWPFSTLMALSEEQRVEEGFGADAAGAIDEDGILTDFERFYPTDVMETGYDILPFWVMRMLLIGKYRTGELPFRDIYLHGLVRDEKGDKMSKSKGNVINPLDIIDEYGADALRMALVIRSSAGLDKSVGRRDFKAMRNFSNKIWNAARFASMLILDDSYELPELEEGAAERGEAFRSELAATVAEITQQIDDFKLGLAADTVYNTFWHDFCDERIEEAKRGELPTKDIAHGLETYLKLLHPFMPFVTEALWQELAEPLGFEEELLVTSAWPTVGE